MTPDEDALRALSGRLAALLMSEQGARIVAMLRRRPGDAADVARSESIALAASRLAHRARGGARSDRVGIWERDAEGGFTRSRQQSGEWSRWADVDRIEPKRTGPRVVLLGESVARGFFYDPSFCVARVLQSMLDAVPLRDADVVDLARIGLTDRELKILVQGVHVLEPDAIVVMAGNNWCGRFRPQDGDGIRSSRGLRGAWQARERALRIKAASVVGVVADVARWLAIPAVVVIPEYNLADWWPESLLVPRLPGDGSSRWVDEYRRVVDALEGNDADAAAAMAERLLAFDEGTSAAAWHLLARCQILAGRVEPARRSQQMARFAAEFNGFVNWPGILVPTQDGLRAECLRRGVRTVDLPTVFARAEPGLPGRRFFHDYCHLTVEGMVAAMAATTRELAAAIEGDDVAESELAAVAARPSPEIEARAYFHAAIHSSHWGQSPEVVRYQCTKATELFPAIGVAMADFSMAQARVAPSQLTESFGRLVASSPAAAYYLPRFTWAQKLMDGRLFSELGEAAARTGVEFGPSLDRVMADEHAVEGREIDLLEPERFATSYCDQGLAVRDQTHAAFLVAYGSRTHFYMSAGGRVPVRLKLTFRVPEAQAGANVKLLVNGVVCGEYHAADHWTTVSAILPAHRMRAGVNEIGLQWPSPAVAPADVWNRIADAVEMDLMPEIFTRFGEVFSFVATPLEASRRSGSTEMEQDERT